MQGCSTISWTLKSTQIRKVPKSEFSGSQKGGGEVKRGEVVGKRTGPEEERGRETEEKGVGGVNGPLSLPAPWGSGNL